jgi:hypothetical protein
MTADEVATVTEILGRAIHELNHVLPSDADELGRLLFMRISVEVEEETEYAGGAKWVIGTNYGNNEITCVRQYD